MALTKVFGSTSIDFGTTLAASVAGIAIVTGCELSRALETNTTAKDENGAICAHVLGNEKYNLSIDGYVASGGTGPVMNATMTVKGQSGKVTGVTITASNENFTTVKVTGEGYAGLTY